jgi:hypothetical protein
MSRPGPHRRIEPLTPPPDRFDAIFREATARRYHRAAAAVGVTGVFLAGIFGGMAMGGPSGVRTTVMNAAGLGDSASPTTTTTTDGTTPASQVPSGAVSGRKRSAGDTVTAPPEQVAPAYLRGEVLNAAGSPVSGLYVYTGVTTAEGFVPSVSPARTNSSGWYQVPCTGGPLLITPWRLNVNLGPSATGGYAARFVDTPSCAKTEHHLVTRVEEGAVVQGDVHTDVSCLGEEFPLWLWIGGDRLASVRLSGIEEGARYRISGAPQGTSIVGARGVTHAVNLRSGETEEQDVTYACPSRPTTTPDPTTSPDPTPTGPTGSPSPTDPTPSTSVPTGSGTGGTGGSGTSSPDPSGH